MCLRWCLRCPYDACVGWLGGWAVGCVGWRLVGWLVGTTAGASGVPVMLVLGVQPLPLNLLLPIAVLSRWGGLVCMGMVVAAGADLDRSRRKQSVGIGEDKRYKGAVTNATKG